MSQKNYNMLIVENLLKGENHIRGIARELSTNQTTIARKIIELSRANVVDYKFKGRNKTYFLKKSFDGKQQAYNVELYKTVEAVKKFPQLRRIIEAIRENKRISLAIIFGSYSKGSPNEESDIDIYIETNDRKIKEEVENIDSRLSVKIGKYDKANILIKEIEKNHIIIKGVEEYYEKNGFFR